MNSTIVYLARFEIISLTSFRNRNTPRIIHSFSIFSYAKRLRFHFPGECISPGTRCYLLSAAVSHNESAQLRYDKRYRLVGIFYPQERYLSSCRTLHYTLPFSPPVGPAFGSRWSFITLACPSTLQCYVFFKCFKLYNSRSSQFPSVLDHKLLQRRLS